MKRAIREESVCEGSAGFPVPFLVMLEPYLGDRDLSSLARCCPRHMVLCYMRAERVFRWGKKQSLFADQHDFFFPLDQFLQMQLAKLFVASSCELDHAGGVTGAMSDAFLQVDNIIASQKNKKKKGKKDEKEVDESIESIFMPFMRIVPTTLSFSRYALSVCFVDGMCLLDTHKKTTKLGTTAIGATALSIIGRLPVAKCSFAVLTSNVRLYELYRPTVPASMASFVKEALHSLVSPTSDATLFVREVDFFNDDENMADVLFEYLEASGNNGSFYFFEHPIVQKCLAAHNLVAAEDWFASLLDDDDATDSARRCCRLMDDLKLSKYQVLDIVTSQDFSFIADSCDVSKEKDRKELLSWFSSSRVSALLNFHVTRRATRQRLSALLPYVETDPKFVAQIRSLLNETLSLE